MKLKKVPDWSIYDSVNNFQLRHAACLWLECEPIDQASPPEETMIWEREKVIRDWLKRLYPFEHFTLELDGAKRIEPWDERDSISREDLISLAKDRNEKTKFLFPDERDLPVPGKKRFDTRERKSYLKLIEALLTELEEVRPMEVGKGARLEEMAQKAGFSDFTDDTALKILREIDELKRIQPE